MLYTCLDNPFIPLCFLGVMIIKLSFILFNSLFVLWITSFINKGVLTDDGDAKDIITMINILSVFGSLVFFKPAGYITDRYPAYIVIPVSFIWRAIGLALFFLIKTPK